MFNYIKRMHILIWAILSVMLTPRKNYSRICYIYDHLRSFLQNFEVLFLIVVFVLPLLILSFICPPSVMYEYFESGQSRFQ